MSAAFKPLLAKLADGAALTDEDASAFFTACLRGELGAAQIAAAVTAMRMRGETVGEITASARAMRAAAVSLDHPYQVIDTCGTGGDGLHTLNISTAADVLSALGVNITATLAQSRRALDEANICFLFAVAHHGAMRHVLPVRQELGFRTIFNLLGPLSNPAGAQRQVLGVFDPRWVEPLARVLGALGSTRAWVVHGQGLDELTTTGSSQVAEWRDGGIRLFTVTPEAAGLPSASLSDLRGGDPATNAQAIRDLLDGRPGPYRDVVLLNTAAALLVSDTVDTLREGAVMAAAAIDGGGAATALARLVEASNG
jgi:anthranilate phosphoribosyltransferase